MDEDQIRRLVGEYAAAWGRGDRSAWLDTFAPTATQEDPIGEHVRRGKGEIGEFWDRALAGRDSLEIRPRAIHVVGGEAALVWTIVARSAGTWTTFDGVDVFTFTPEPLIESVRAYWERSTFKRSSQPPN